MVELCAKKKKKSPSRGGTKQFVNLRNIGDKREDHRKKTYIYILLIMAVSVVYTVLANIV